MIFLRSTLISSLLWFHFPNDSVPVLGEMLDLDFSFLVSHLNGFMGGPRIVDPSVALMRFASFAVIPIISLMRTTVLISPSVNLMNVSFLV